MSRLRWLTGVAVGGLAGAAGLALAVRSQPPGVDLWLHDAAVRHRGGVIALARLVTQGGSTVVVWPMIGVAAVVFPRSSGVRRWVTSALVAGGAGAAIGVRLLASLAVRRERPPQADWATVPGGFAYPSGHTTSATIGVGVLAWALARRLRDRSAAGSVPAWPVGGVWVVWVVAVGYAAAVGWSRVLLGVHWPTDVLGGWLLGTGWLAAMAATVDRWRR